MKLESDQTPYQVWDFERRLMKSSFTHEAVIRGDDVRIGTTVILSLPEVRVNKYAKC